MRHTTTTKVATFQVKSSRTYTGSPGVSARTKIRTFAHYMWLRTFVVPPEADFFVLLGLYAPNYGLGKCKVVDLRPEKIQELYAHLKPSTAQHCHSALRAALNVAVKWDVIKRNPALKVEAPQHQAREIPFLTADQITKLLEHAQGQYHALFTFMVSSGVRPGEAFALRWTDLNEGMTTATIQRSVSWRESGGYQYTPLKTSRKTKKRGRSVSLPAGLAPVLREHRAQQAQWFLEAGVRSELVFCCETGGPLSPRNVTIRGLRPTLVAAKLPTTITLYSLRHSFASVMLAWESISNWYPRC
jgi:integrase